MSEHCFGGPYAVPYMVPVSECCARYGGPCGSDEPSGPGRYSFLQSRRSTGRSGGICREEAGQFPARLEWGGRAFCFVRRFGRTVPTALMPTGERLRPSGGVGRSGIFGELGTAPNLIGSLCSGQFEEQDGADRVPAGRGVGR